MLKACMINGFGWFEEERYRRSWLLFDEVEYLFPVSRLTYPPSRLANRPEFQVIQPTMGEDAIRSRIERARLDAEDPKFRAFVNEHASKADLSIAWQIVAVDDEMANVDTNDPFFCLSYLIEKLLDHAESSGTIPIVGQDYALDLIRTKLQRRSQVDLSEQALVTTKQAVNLFAFQAGLSYRFLTDADLKRTDINKLRKFKDDNRDLLNRHHAHIVTVTQGFDGLPRTSEFAVALAKLKAEAEATAQSLDDSAKDAWLDAGLTLLQKGISSTASGAVTALGILATISLATIYHNAVPAMVIGAGTVANAAASVASSIRRSRRNHHIAYLVNAHRYLSG